MMQSRSSLPVLLLGAGIGVMLVMAIRSFFSSSDADAHAAAFARGETDRENFDQTRSAGPEAMRSHEERNWDKVDQALDESFPASDPPATY
ncbi:MAG: hypothetical protein ACRCY3_00670 [Sphingorhabdus sp.]